MTVAIRIVSFTIANQKSRATAEKELAKLLNDRWIIISQGGNDGQAFFVLQKGEAEHARSFPFANP